MSKVRADFPILNQSVHGVPMVYLDSAATAQKPNTVIDAIAAYYREDNANVHRAQHSLAARATAGYEQSRERIRRFVHAKNTREIIFTRGTTESINLVASSFGRTLKRGDAIILTEMEHHSNLIPWQMLATQRQLELRFIPFDAEGKLEYGRLDDLWSPDVKLVALTHMSNVFGTVNDVRRVVEYAHQRGVPVLVDGAQAVPHLPIDVGELGCDFYAFSGHKMCGPTGIGVLYGREEMLDGMEPFMGGGEMISSVWLDRAKWNELPYKFEAGTPNIAGAIGLGAAIDYLDGLGMDAIAASEEELTTYAINALTRIDGLSLYGPTSNRGGVLSFNLGNVHSHDVAQFLDSRGIAIRAGHHCAHPIMRKLEISSTVRASLYLYNNADDIDRLCTALVECKEFFAHGV